MQVSSKNREMHVKKKIHMMHLENLVTLNMLAKKSHPDLKATGVSINE